MQSVINQLLIQLRRESAAAMTPPFCFYYDLYGCKLTNHARLHCLRKSRVPKAKEKTTAIQVFKILIHAWQYLPRYDQRLRTVGHDSDVSGRSLRRLLLGEHRQRRLRPLRRPYGVEGGHPELVLGPGMEHSHLGPRRVDR